MRNTVIMAGGYSIDTKGASAVRALGLAHLFEHLGYKVILLGKFREKPDEILRDGEVLVDGICCRDIFEPFPGRKCRSYIHTADPIMQVVDEYGAERVLAILCYNFPARGAWSVIRQARHLGIAPILDCTEWHGWEGRKVMRNLWRLAGVEMRMRVLCRMAGNVSCATHWFRERLSGQHTVLWPFVLDTNRPEWQRGPMSVHGRPIHLVYSGSPGLGMYKDRLPVMIGSLARLAACGEEFSITIAGITEEEYLESVPAHRVQLDQLDNKLRFLGRITHQESLSLLRSADFSVFFRRPNRVSHTGFATKYVEAATLGIPVISNPTSDLPSYLRDGENGIMATSISDADVYTALHRAVCLKPDQRAAMFAACRAENPFDMRAWQDDASEFLQNLRGLK